MCNIWVTRLAISPDSTVHDGNLVLNELHLYGSSLLGMMQMQDTLFHYTAMRMYDLGSTHTPLYSTATITQPNLFDSVFVHQRGSKVYEGTNHLGNVLVTYSDKRLTECQEDTIYRYVADVKSQTDYSAFHALLPDRQWYSNNDSSNYRFGGSNGQEKTDELSGIGNHYTAEYWEMDPRLGRRWNVDPKLDPWESPYVSFMNSPLFHSDVLGDTEDERKAAVAKAKEHRDKKSTYAGNNVKEKEGEPGGTVDCSGLINQCAKAAGIENLNSGKGDVQWRNGVANIANNIRVRQVPLNELREGDFITIDSERSDGNQGENGKYDHIGIVTNVEVENGVVKSLTFIHASSGKNAVIESTYTPGKGYYGNRVRLGLQWDTPDNEVNIVKNDEIPFNTPPSGPPKQFEFRQAPSPKWSQDLQQNQIPIVKTLGEILELIGY